MTHKNQKSPEIEDGALELRFNIKQDTFGKCTTSPFSYYVVKQFNGCWKHLDIDSFEYHLRIELCLSKYDGFSYVKYDDGDVIYIDSQDIFEDVVKYTRACNKKNKKVLLIVERGVHYSEYSVESALKDVSSLESNNLLLFELLSVAPQPANVMASSTISEIAGKIDNMTVEEKLNNPSEPLSISDSTPPVWFKEYMEMLKRDIVQEVSSEVMTSVMDILNKHSSEKSCSSCCNFSLDHNRRSHDTYSGESQYRKEKRVVKEVNSNDILPSFEQDAELHRLERIGEFERTLKFNLNSKLTLLEQKMRIILEKKKEVAALIDDVDNDSNVREEVKNLEPIKIKESAAIKVPESVFPLWMETKCVDDYAANIINQSDANTVGRTSCSITGHEMFDETKVKDSEYINDFDGDDISIISDLSNISGAEQDTFEIIPMPSCIAGKTTENNCDFTELNDLEMKQKASVASSISEDDVKIDSCKAENDRNNNTNSSTFEILCKRTSSIEPIQMVENRFVVIKNESNAHVPKDNLINFEDENTYEYHVPHYIAEQNTLRDNSNNLNDNIKLMLGKRSGGMYSYINQTLPSRDTNELSKSVTYNEERLEDNYNLTKDAERSHHVCMSNDEVLNSSKPSKTEHEYQSQADDISHESTQSFSSHTTFDTRNAFTEFDTGYKHVIIDNNVSKGLEETECSPCVTNVTYKCEANKSQKMDDTDRKRQSGFTSKDYVKFSVEQPTEFIGEFNRRHKFYGVRLGPGEPVNVLPELLVSGVEQVAFSVCSTARRVLSKMRNVQMGEDINKMKMGW